MWGSGDAAPDGWTSQFFGGGVGRRQLKEFFPLAGEDYLAADAAAAPLAAPEVTLLEDAREGETRRLRLRGTSPRGAPLVNVYAGAEGGFLGSSVGGVEAPAASKGGGVWGLRYYAFPREGIELTLRTKSAGAVRVRVNDVSRAGFARRRGWTNEEVTAAQRAAPVRTGGTPRRRGARRMT